MLGLLSPLSLLSWPQHHLMSLTARCQLMSLFSDGGPVGELGCAVLVG